MQILGIDELNKDIIKQYYNKTDTIYKYTTLINNDNIKQNTSNEPLKDNKRSKIINKLINELGYTNIFDNKTINENTFDKNLETIKTNNEIFNDKFIKINFNMNKLNKDITTKKAQIGYINTLLHNYNLAKLTLYAKLRLRYVVSLN